MIALSINKLAQGEHLDRNEASSVMREIMEGTVSDAQIAAFLTAMHIKGETIEEITACAMILREKCLKIYPQQEALDIVGTGGDKSNTFNISTTSSFVIAAGGVPVAKHGNRSMSSKCGAADVLEALGVNIDLEPAQSEKILEEAGVCFLFAQKYHSSMRYAGPVRKEIGIPTVFNYIGPLSNPAQVKMQLMGVYDRALVEPLAKVLVNLGLRKGMVVYGNGIDEATLTGTTTICEFDEGKYKKYDINPEEFGLKRCELSELIGGLASDNAMITHNILVGSERGAKRDAVLLNAGLGLYIGGKVLTIEEGIKMAKYLLDSGRAINKLKELVALSNA
ncbi:MAG TPA: anthranilate phosphoribosyltransferase [Candidatus Avacidaminococcus intestinavium]|uniref:Anthranilate phosphoribosyltransferase n=1 Tax=Candidatus Avacidaminococcus intestinavium TaxID=2840684 RepID=A0A9D1MPP8_9FIRM|nr:anthranilate phosphoribosyltransferase [Candidatus Avacidaminococcus intestinavium]